MVDQRFPGANLIGQLLRQATQPLSKAIVKHVRKQPFLRRYVLIQLGRFYYWCEDKIKVRKIPAAREKREKPVDDVSTMELGAQLLLEVLVFGFLWSVIVYETRRSAERSRATEQQRIREFNDLEAEKNRLMRRVEDQVVLTRQLKDIVAEYSRRVECTLPDDPDEGERE